MTASSNLREFIYKDTNSKEIFDLQEKRITQNWD